MRTDNRRRGPVKSLALVALALALGLIMSGCAGGINTTDIPKQIAIVLDDGSVIQPDCNAKGQNPNDYAMYVAELSNGSAADKARLRNDYNVAADKVDDVVDNLKSQWETRCASGKPLTADQQVCGGTTAQTCKTTGALVFTSIPEVRRTKEIIKTNTDLQAVANNGNFATALGLVKELKEAKVQVDKDVPADALKICGDAGSLEDCQNRGRVAFDAIPADKQSTQAKTWIEKLESYEKDGLIPLAESIDLVTKLQAEQDKVAGNDVATGTDSNGGTVNAPFTPSDKNLPVYNGRQANDDGSSPPVVTPADGKMIGSWTELDARMGNEPWYWECGERVTGTNHTTDIPKWKSVEATDVGSRFVLAVNVGNLSDDEILAKAREAGNQNIVKGIPIFKVKSYLNTRGIKNHECEEFIDDRPQVRVGVAMMVQDAQGKWFQDPYSGFATDSCSNWGKLLRSVGKTVVGPNRPKTLPPPKVKVPPSKTTKLTPKSSNPDDYVVEDGAPKATVNDSASSPSEVETSTQSSGGNTESASNDAGSETGITAPGAEPPPAAPSPPPPVEEGGNTGTGSTCVKMPGQETC